MRDKYHNLIKDMLSDNLLSTFEERDKQENLLQSVVFKFAENFWIGTSFVYDNAQQTLSECQLVVRADIWSPDISIFNKCFSS